MPPGVRLDEIPGNGPHDEDPPEEEAYWEDKAQSRRDDADFDARHP